MQAEDPVLPVPRGGAGPFPPVGATHLSQLIRAPKHVRVGISWSGVPHRFGLCFHPSLFCLSLEEATYHPKGGEGGALWQCCSTPRWGGGFDQSLQRIERDRMAMLVVLPHGWGQLHAQIVLQGAKIHDFSGGGARQPGAHSPSSIEATAKCFSMCDLMEEFVVARIVVVFH